MTEQEARDYVPRCTPCGMSHVKCEGQQNGEAIARRLYNAIQCGNQLLIDQAKTAYEEWLA